MPQQHVELILMRQLASYLAFPIFILDKDELLLFYNEAAEGLLGRRFDEVGEIRLEELPKIFEIADADGTPMLPENTPLGIALRQQKPAHQILTYNSLDGVKRRAEVTALPLTGQGGRHLGAVAMFWEAEEK